MAGENVVRIVVTSDNQTQAGFGEAAAGADEMAGKVTAAMEEYKAAADEAAAAADELTAASERLDEAQAGGEASAGELAAAQDAYAAALDRASAAATASMDAQLRLGEADLAASDSAKTAGDAQEELGAKTDTSAGLMAGAGAKMKMALLGVGVGMGLAVKSAANFQDATTHLVTDAGESAKNLAMVQQGILAVSAATGTSANDITNAMYHIESGGYHGAAGLQLLKVAAEGAKVGGADLDTVSKTLVGTMNAYGLSSSHAASFMNQLIATVGAGDMRMQDLASSLSSVAPLAAAVHLQFSQVGGAIATMTAQGMTAQQATQDLANTIRSLSNPNNVAINEMQQLGINSQDVSKNLGSRGLAGTIDMLTQAITSHMGKAGMVMMSTFNQAKFAAADAETEIKAMPASLQALAKGFLDGSISAKSWRTDLQGLPPVQQHLMQQFATTAEKAHSFNTLLAAGGPAAQTYTAALAKMMGGATGLNTALMLSGSRAGVFAGNVATVAAAARKGGGQVSNWSVIQGTFNFKLQQAKASIEDMGISLGSVLLPAVTAVLGPVSHMLSLIASNKLAATALAVVIGGVLAGALGSKLAGAFKGVESGVKGLGAGFEMLAGKLGIMTAAQDAQTVATEEGAVAQGEMDAAMDANPIGVIIGLLAILAVGIYEIVKHWKMFKDAAVDAWHRLRDAGLAAWHFLDNDVIHPIMSAVDGLVNWIREHWKLLATILATILLGPVGALVVFIATHWKEITRLTSELYHDVTGFFTSLGSDVTRIASEIWHDVTGFFTRMGHDVLSAVVSLVTGYVNWWLRLTEDAVSLTVRLVTDVVSWFARLPGMIINALAGLAGMLFNAGAHAIDSLISGLTSGIGKIGSAMGGIASKIAGFIGLSPAKEGPLSAGGAPQVRGQHIAADVAAGILSGVPQVGAAATRLASAAGITGAGTLAGGTAGGGGAAGGGGWMELRAAGAGAVNLMAFVQMLWPGLVLEVRHRGGGGPFSAQKALGQTWPAGA